MTVIKICGLREPETLKAAVEAGARFIGFVFYPPSPRYIAPAQAGELMRMLPSTVRSVGLFVDPTDETLENTIALAPVDMIQLHGSESPERVKDIREKLMRPIIKAIGVRHEPDLDSVKKYEPVSDWLLFDARPENASLPGGTGQSFDWSLLAEKTFTIPWMLSGGLDENNVQTALAALKPDAVDVSSGVERARGVKDSNKIKTFINKVKEL